MSEENKPEVEQTEEHSEGCGCGEHADQEHGPWMHMRGHWMRKRMMMHFASMSVEEEVELLESVKEGLEERLKVVDEKLAKLKA